MGFTRKFLAGLGLEADKIEAIMDAHVEVVDGLKAKATSAADAADELAKVKGELEQAKNDLKSARETIAETEKADYKGQLEAEKAAHEKLKADIEAEKTAAKREAALTKAAKSAKYSADAIATILDSKRDYAGRIEFDDDGNPTNIESVMQAIADDKPNLTPKVTEKRHTPATPPAESVAKGGMTWEQIDQISNTEERQAAMIANMESLGLK